MADLEQLLNDLQNEVVVEVDYDAPEAGQFPPQLSPGVYDFIFTLPEDSSARFDKIEVDGHSYLQVTHGAEVLVPGESEPKKLNFLRVSHYKSPKMANSGVGDLLRSLGIKLTDFDTRSITTALTQADHTARGRFALGWQRYCKNCQCTVSTAPRKKKAPKVSDAPWPRNGDKQPELIVACPLCGEKGYGREFVVNYLLPPKEDAHA